MKTRKLVLLIADALLLVALVLQLSLKSGDKVHTYELKDEPDEITLIRPDESFTIVQTDGKWFIGEKKYPANESYVQNLVDALSSIKVLDKVAVANNESTISRYELEDGKCVKVVAKKNGKEIRSLVVGKQSTAGSQSYITLDGGKDIYLSSGGLSSSLDKKMNYYRSREVYSVPKEDISSVTITNADGEKWTLSRIGSGENLIWTINVPDVAVDSSKAADWFNVLGTLLTPVWHDDAELTGEFVCKFEMTAGSKSISLELYKTVVQGDEGEDKDLYFATSSETPYQFELANYAVQRFTKTLEDIIQ